MMDNVIMSQQQKLHHWGGVEAYYPGTKTKPVVNGVNMCALCQNMTNGNINKT